MWPMPTSIRQDDPEAALQGETRRVFWVKLSGYGAYVILGLLFCLFIARPLIQMLSGRPAETVVETMLPRTVQELEAGMERPGMLPATEEAVAGHFTGRDWTCQAWQANGCYPACPGHRAGKTGSRACGRNSPHVAQTRLIVWQMWPTNKD